MKTDDAPLFPISLYIYRTDGRYGLPTVIRSEQELNSERTTSKLREAVRSGVEVRMTDPMDHLVFHAKGGKILFPTERDREREREHSRERSR